MSQSTPLIREAAAQADHMKEVFLRLSADGEVCAEDIAILQPLIADLKETTHQAELAYAWGMAVFKRGMEGKRAKELESENEHLEQIYSIEAA